MHEDVPAHLRHQLWTWTAGYINLNSRGTGAQKVRDIANHMRYDFAQAPQLAVHASPEQRMRAYIERRCQEPEEQLRIIEFLLPSVHESSAKVLEDVLRLGNSAYAVSSDGKRLEMRATPEVKTQVEAVVASAAGSAGDHLANAWNEAYGREPDPVKSYSESVKSVEAALAQHVSPQNGKQTLGTMIRDVSAKPSKWKFTIADGNVGGIDTVLHMMRMLWDGQTSRDGGVNPTRDETPEEAKAAVHLAATLVEFGISAAFSVA
jgi:hypothetical protein